MNIEEANKILEGMNVYPEELTGESKRLFEAIMIIADSRDKAEADLYEANHRITDLLLILGDRDRMIDEMANEIYIEHNPHFNAVEDVKKYFEERCK